MAKPKTPKSTPPSNLLTIHVRDDEDLQTFFVNLLHSGYIHWLSANGRYRTLLAQGQEFPLTTKQRFAVWRKFFTQVSSRWWTDYTDHPPKRDPRSMQGRCFRVIQKIVVPLWAGDDSTPLRWNGDPLSAYRLADLMGKEDPDLKEEVCKNYARLWLIIQKFTTPALFTSDDLKFLKRHDRNAYHGACALLSGAILLSHKSPFSK